MGGSFGLNRFLFQKKEQIILTIGDFADVGKANTVCLFIETEALCVGEIPRTRGFHHSHSFPKKDDTKNIFVKRI